MNKKLKEKIWSMLPDDEEGLDEDLLLADYVNLLFVSRGSRPAMILSNVELKNSLHDAGYSMATAPGGGLLVARKERQSWLDTQSNLLLRMKEEGDERGYELLGRVLGYPASSDFIESKRSNRTYSVEYLAKLKEFPASFSVFSNVFIRDSLFPVYENHFSHLRSSVSDDGVKMIGVFWSRYNGHRKEIGRLR